MTSRRFGDATIKFSGSGYMQTETGGLGLGASPATRFHERRFYGVLARRMLSSSPAWIVHDHEDQDMRSTVQQAAFGGAIATIDNPVRSRV